MCFVGWCDVYCEFVMYILFICDNILYICGTVYTYICYIYIHTIYMHTCDL